jgi:DNA-directed RNA polymerase specialized sigma24 family protein
VSTLAAPIANLFEAGVEADRGLVQRAKLGDEHAFFGLYEMHGRGIYSWSLKAAESVAAAEDLTRLVFLEAFTNLDSVPDDRAFACSLYRKAIKNVVSRRLVDSSAENSEQRLSSNQHLSRHQSPSSL